MISQEVKSPEGRVDGPRSWRSCRSIPYFYLSCFCHALLQIIRIGDPFFTGVDQFLSHEFFKPMGWNLHFHLKIDVRA